MILFVLIICLIFLIQHGNAHSTQLCIKKEEFMHKNNVTFRNGDFLDFILNNNVYVDKSMLAHRLMENEGEVKVITCPSGWGKSMNLKMLKFFFELPSNISQLHYTETRAYKYFAQGIITDGKTTHELRHKPKISLIPEFVDKHISKYPVIYIDFSKYNVKLPTFSNVLLGFKIIVRQIFREFQYVTRVWENKTNNANQSIYQAYIQKFFKFAKLKEDDWACVASSINLLTKALNEYHNEKVIILHDNFDKLTHLMRFNKDMNHFEEDKLVIEHFYKTFLQKTYDDNRQIIQLAVLTGELPLIQSNPGSTAYLKHYRSYNIVDMKNLCSMFGLNEYELQVFLNFYQIPEQESNIREWYGQYYYTHQPNAMILNLLSVVNFFDKKFEMQNYWEDDGRETFGFVFQALRHAEFRDEIEKLLANGTTLSSYNQMRTINNEDLNIMEKIFHNRLQKMDQDALETILRFCCIVGLLTSEPQSTKGKEYREQNLITLRIPNREIKTHISAKLQQFHENT